MSNVGHAPGVLGFETKPNKNNEIG